MNIATMQARIDQLDLKLRNLPNENQAMSEHTFKLVGLQARLDRLEKL